MGVEGKIIPEPLGLGASKSRTGGCFSSLSLALNLPAGFARRGPYLSLLLLDHTRLSVALHAHSVNTQPLGAQLRILEGRDPSHKKGHTKTFKADKAFRILFFTHMSEGNTVKGLLISLP